MLSLPRTVSGRVGTLVLAGLLVGLLSAPAASQSRDTTRPLPAECQPLVAEFAPELRDARRRLDRTRGQPDAAKAQSSILATTLAQPGANADLSKLLACLTK